MKLLHMLALVIRPRKLGPAYGTLVLLVGHVVVLGVLLVLDPVVPVHVPLLCGAVVAALGGFAGDGQFVLAFDVFAERGGWLLDGLSWIGGVGYMSEREDLL